MCFPIEIISSTDKVDDNIKITHSAKKRAKCCTLLFLIMLVLGGILLAVGIVLIQIHINLYWQKYGECVSQLEYDSDSCLNQYTGFLTPGLSLTIIAPFILLTSFICFCCCCRLRSKEIFLSVETGTLSRTIQHPFSKYLGGTKIEFDLRSIHSIEPSNPFTSNDGGVDITMNFYKYPPMKMGVSFHLSNIETLKNIFLKYKGAHSFSSPDGKPYQELSTPPYQTYMQSLPYQQGALAYPYQGDVQVEGTSQSPIAYQAQQYTDGGEYNGYHNYDGSYNSGSSV